MAHFSKIKAILFDLDGTLIEHTWQLSQITNALFNHFAAPLAPLTYDEFYEVFWNKNADLWYMMVDGVIDGDTAQVYSYINTLRTLKKDTSLAVKMVDYWTTLVLQEATPFDDAYTILQTLRPHFTIGIVTNGFKQLQRAKLTRYHFEEAVDFCLVSEEVGYHKPDVRIFQRALEAAGNLQPTEAIFIGDTVQADIKGAQEAGIHPVFINTRDDQQPPEGVIKIIRLSQLLNLLDL